MSVISRNRMACGRAHSMRTRSPTQDERHCWTLASLSNESVLKRGHSSANESLQTFSQTGRQMGGLTQLVAMLRAAGRDRADVSATLLELPDSEDVRVPRACKTAFYVSAHSSFNKTNGTAEVVGCHLPFMQHITVAGSHFDFIRHNGHVLSADIIHFFAYAHASRGGEQGAEGERVE